MKERPILMSAPMVRAILEGRKTQTRREQALTPKTVLNAAARKIGFTIAPELARYDYPVKGVPRIHVPMRHPADSMPYEDCGCAALYCPYGQPGDRLWVKETFCLDAQATNGVLHRASWDARVLGAEELRKFTPSIFMRRQYSRITLEITGVRVEQLADITPADARAEGIEKLLRPAFNDYWWKNYGKPAFANHIDEQEQKRELHYFEPVLSYKSLWESINGKGSWAKNPWVWVLTFKRV